MHLKLLNCFDCPLRGQFFLFTAKKENDPPGFDNQLPEILQQVVKINVIRSDQQTSVRQYPVTVSSSANHLFKPLPHLPSLCQQIKFNFSVYVFPLSSESISISSSSSRCMENSLSPLRFNTVSYLSDPAA
jgi:hypothetical protein